MVSSAHGPPSCLAVLKAIFNFDIGSPPPGGPGGGFVSKSAATSLVLGGCVFYYFLRLRERLNPDLNSGGLISGHWGWPGSGTQFATNPVRVANKVQLQGPQSTLTWTQGQILDFSFLGALKSIPRPNFR